MMAVDLSMVVSVNKTLPLKREIVRVGNGEKIEFQPYQNFRLLSNSIFWSTIKFYKHAIFIDICTS